AEHDVVLFEESRCRLGRSVWIEALVDDAVDAQEAAARAAHELPHPGGADFRIGIRVERRFDVRQCRELARQPHALERVRDVIVPSAGANEAFTEPIRLAELETDFFGSLLETRATRVARP